MLNFHNIPYTHGELLEHKRTTNLPNTITGASINFFNKILCVLDDLNGGKA